MPRPPASSRPPDLVGLPTIKDGRTEYALPHVLPKGGAGILLLEELNRAERYIQQPALQLLSARRLHEYVLPAGWVCVATVNPQTAEYHVTALDKALRARFLQVSVRADRASWLAWAQTAERLHPGVVGGSSRRMDEACSTTSPRGHGRTCPIC